MHFADSLMFCALNADIANSCGAERLAYGEEFRGPSSSTACRHVGQSPPMFRMPQDLLGTVLNVIDPQDTHKSLIGSLELNICKGIAMGWEPQASSTRACG
jgi:hypothetical protein